MFSIQGGQFLYGDNSPIAAGVLTLTLSQAATVISTGLAATTVYTFNLDANGIIIGPANVNGNAELTPSGSSYTTVVKVANITVWGPFTWIVGPSAPYAGTLYPGVIALPLITAGGVRPIAAGTTLTSGDFTLSGWGSGAAISAVLGKDSAWQLTITAGTTPNNNPTLTLTFRDGAWASAPICITKQNGGTGATSDILDAPSATQNVVTWLGTPTSGLTYSFSSVSIGALAASSGVTSLAGMVLLTPTGTQVITGFGLTVPSITTGKINGMFWVDGTKYALTGAGIRAAIADAVAAGGGKVILTAIATLDSTTIIVGQEVPSKPVYLSLEYIGNMTGVANPVFELTSHSAIVGLNRRATQLTIPAGGTGIRITTPAEDWDIANLWFQAGAIAIKSRGNSSTVDTPNGRIRYNFLQSQTGNAIELASFADGATLDTNFTNSSGGAGIRIGVLNNGEPNGGTNENSSIINNFVQNAGTKGIWIEPTAFTTAWQAVGLILDNNQISTPANDGLWIKGGIRLCDIRNTLFVGAITGTINTYDHLHIEQFVGGVVQFNNRVSGVYQGDSTKPRYSIFWDQLDPTNSGLGGNILERVQVSTGQTSGIYVRGDIKITDIGNSVIAPTSLFQSASAFTGGLQFTMKNQINSPMVMALDSGLNAIQNTTLSFRDRGTSKFEIIKTDTNEIDFNIPGVGTFLRVVAGTILPVFQVDNAAAIAVKNAAATTTVLAVDTTSGGNGVNCTAPAGGGFSLNAGGTAHLNTLWLVAKMSRYQDIATVSGGIPAEYATIDTTGLTANVAAATLYAATASGMYRVSAYVVETTAGSVSSTLPNVQIIYTDPDTNASITIDATPVLGVAGIGQTGALTANTIGTASSGVIAISVKTGTTIQYQTVGYASSAAGMAYALHIKLEAL